MAIDRARLRDQLVYIECADSKVVELDARGYQRAALELRQAVAQELGSVPMQAFLHRELEALQTIAQNVFFEGRCRFADLDGSGAAQRACDIAGALFYRLTTRR